MSRPAPTLGNVIPDQRPNRFARIAAGGWSLVLFACGGTVDMYNVMNVPGAAHLAMGPPPQASVTDLGVGLALAALLAWGSVFVRKRAPWLALVAGGALLAVGVSYLLALVGVYHALLRWPERGRLIAGGAAIAVGLYVGREVMTDWGAGLPWLFGADPSRASGAWAIARWVIALLAALTVGGLVLNRRTRKDAEVSRSRAEREHERADALGEQLARQAERARIARDLHDGLGHRLASAALSASAFEAQAAADPSLDPALTEWARAVRQQTTAALEDVRGVVGALRADGVTDEPASPASLRVVSHLLHDLRDAGHRIDAYVMLEGIDRIGVALDAAAYRILQECLTNSIKHAPGAHVSVTLDASPARGVRIRVENDLGSSSADIPAGGHGIIGIRERAESTGGTAWIGPHRGRFIVDVALPWDERG